LKKKISRILIFFFVIFIYSINISSVNAVSPEIFSTTGAGTWTAPNGVTSVIVDTWAGGGGGGGSSVYANAPGGGAGGGFASTTVAVLPGTTYNYYVGAGGTAGIAGGANGGVGGDSWFLSSATVLSKGGGGGRTDGSGTGGGGATTTGAIGTVIYNGGNGAAGATNNYSGAGGGGAGSAGNGGVAVTYNAGSGGSPDGGAGGAGGPSCGVGGPGNTLGGGGGGGEVQGFCLNKNGGAGAQGQVKLTYTILILVPTVTASSTSSITYNTATLNGNITNTGAMVGVGTQHGFAYGTSTDLSVTSSTATTTNGTYSATTTFTGNISSLICNTTYYARAYATNSAGTGFGSIVSFNTSTCPARYWYKTGADTNWTTLTGNWWAYSDHTSQAAALPTASDPIATLGTTGPSVDLATWVKPLSIDASTTGIIFTSTATSSPGLNIIGTTTFNGASYNGNTITGNSIFNSTSYNAGTVTGSSTFNGTSYNAGTVTGTSTFSSATGGINTLTTGMQWGSGTSTTIVGSDNAVITSWIFNNNSFNNGTTTGTVTFNSTSYNNATSTGVTTFNETSYNNRNVTSTATTTFNGSSQNKSGATVTGNAIFNADASENLGTVTGTKTRRYTTAISPTRNLTTGGAWTVLADGAIVNVSGTTYDTTTTFSTANGGSFATITTACGAPLLGRNLTYTLSTNTTATCTIGNDNVTLNGADHTLTGGVNGNGSGDGVNGHIFTIHHITVSGSVTANGSTGTVTGGNGGTTTISYSTTGNVSANGGNGATTGGRGGVLTISTTTSAVLSANGGNSTVCGYGGSGGSMNLTDVTYTSSTVNAGSDQTTIGAGLCPSPPSSGSSGSSGSRIIYTSPPAPAPSSSSNTSSQSSNSSSGGSSIFTVNQLAALGLIKIPGFNLLGNNSPKAGSTDLGNPLDNVASPGQLKLSLKAFSFAQPLSSFLFEPLPDSVQKILKKNDKLGRYLAGVGFNQAQDLANLARHPILLPVLEFDPPGLFIIANDGIRLTTYLASDPKHLFVEMVETTPGAKLAVSLIPPSKGKFTGIFDGRTINFVQNQDRISTSITASTTPGRYFLTTPASSLTLAIDVTAPAQTSETPANKQGFFGKIFSWLTKFF